MSPTCTGLQGWGSPITGLVVLLGSTTTWDCDQNVIRPQKGGRSQSAGKFAWRGPRSFSGGFNTTDEYPSFPAMMTWIASYLRERMKPTTHNSFSHIVICHYQPWYIIHYGSIVMVYYSHDSHGLFALECISTTLPCCRDPMIRSSAPLHQLHWRHLHRGFIMVKSHTQINQSKWVLHKSTYIPYPKYPKYPNAREFP